MSSITELVKRAALDAVDSKVPSDIVFGEVIKVKPVEIRIDANLILKEADGQLKFARNVTDYDVSMTVNHTTEDHTHTHDISDSFTGGGSASSNTHKHEYKGTKTFRVHNALKVGETVIMFKKSGGQSYLVYDRLAVKS